MTEFRFRTGAVYIFENTKAQRVKVGMTTTNNVDGRLKDVNDVWLQQKVTCQVCGGRLFIIGGRLPRHPKYGNACLGGKELPLEKDVALAESHLEEMEKNVIELSGSEKGSATRMINTLKSRIKVFRNWRPVGEWQLSSAFYTEYCEGVESRTHEILSEHLDKLAPFGEVFCCSVAEATKAVETVLRERNLLDSVRKDYSMLFGKQNSDRTEIVYGHKTIRAKNENEAVAELKKTKPDINVYYIKVGHIDLVPCLPWGSIPFSDLDLD